MEAEEAAEAEAEWTHSELEALATIVLALGHSRAPDAVAEAVFKASGRSLKRNKPTTTNDALAVGMSVRLVGGPHAGADGTVSGFDIAWVKVRLSSGPEVSARKSQLARATDELGVVETRAEAGEQADETTEARDEKAESGEKAEAGDRVEADDKAESGEKAEADDMAEASILGAFGQLVIA